MLGKKHADVLVVGAGPVGLFTALKMVHQGLEVMIIDREWRRAAHSYALGLHQNTLRLLESVDLLGPVIEDGRKIERIEIFDGAHKRCEIPMAEVDSEYPYMITMQQDRLEGLLERALNEHGVKVHWNHQLVRVRDRGDAVETVIHKLAKETVGYAVAHMEWIVDRALELHFPLVIAADGHRSFIRRSLDIPYEEMGDSQHFAVFELKTSRPVEETMRLVIGPNHVNVLWPLPQQFCRWSFEVAAAPPGEETREKERQSITLGGAKYPILSEEKLREFLRERAPWFQNHAEEIAWRIVVRFEKRLAQQFGRGRIWLAGDACHITGPAGVQSMNVGFREGAMLARLAVDFLKNGAQNVFLNYEQTFQEEWRRLFGKGKRFEPLPGHDPWVMENLERLLPCLPASGTSLDRMMQSLGFRAK